MCKDCLPVLIAERDLDAQVESLVFGNTVYVDEGGNHCVAKDGERTGEWLPFYSEYATPALLVQAQMLRQPSLASVSFMAGLRSLSRRGLELTPLRLCETAVIAMRQYRSLQGLFGAARCEEIEAEYAKT